MNTRILKAIDEVKVMLDTFTFQRDITRIKEILYSLEDVDNYNELLTEVNDLGDRYARLDRIEHNYNFSDNICWILYSIIYTIINESEDNISYMNLEIELRSRTFNSI